MRQQRDTLNRERFPSCPGNRIHEILSPSFLPDGSIHLLVTDKVDVQAEINSYRSDCDMSLILSRLNLGDSSMLRTDVHYGDFTQVPKSMPEMFDLVSRAESAFNKLDPDIRHKFSDSVGIWFSKAGTEEWYDAMAAYFPEPNSAPSAGSAAGQAEKE